MPTVGCFDASAFQRLLEGQLAVPDLEHLASHLERCDRCTRLVQSMPEDKLVALMGSVNRMRAQSEEASRLKTLIQQMLNLRGNVETLDQLAFASQSAGAAPASQPAPPQPATGPSQFIGRYRIVRELGRGGMGTVYQAEDMELRRLVALKVPQFSGPAAHQKQMRQRFLREARAAAAVEHPYVCKIHDVGEHEGTPFVVMAFVEGPSLAGRMAKLGRVKDRAAVALILRIAEALMAVHAKGIIHRDLKPANILLPKDGTPILTDFGLAHVHAESGQLTGEGTLLGTPAYMAPEQAVVELGPVTVRTDLYSLAVVLFQLLTGRLPVEGNVMQMLAHHVARKQAPPPSQFRPDVDAVLDAIIRKAMAVRPEDRHADVGEFSQALKDWGRGAAARPGGAAETGPARLGGAAETMAPLAAAQPLTLAQPAALPAAPIATAPQPAAIPVAQASAVADPQPLPVKSGPRRWAWWHLAAAVLLFAGGVALAIVMTRDKKNEPDGGPMAKGDDKKPNAGQTEFIDEDFRKASEKSGALPEGWFGEAFRVVKQKHDDEAWLELSTLDGEHFVTLPRPLPLSKDFEISGEYLILTSGHKLTLILKGPKNSFLETVIDREGSVTMAGETRRLPGSGKGPGALARQGKRTPFRLTREGDSLRLSLGDDVFLKKLKEVVAYDTLTIGMVEGSIFGTSPGKDKLYRLKVGPVSP